MTGFYRWECGWAQRKSIGMFWGGLRRLACWYCTVGCTTADVEMYWGAWSRCRALDVLPCTVLHVPQLAPAGHSKSGLTRHTEIGDKAPVFP